MCKQPYFYLNVTNPFVIFVRLFFQTSSAIKILHNFQTFKHAFGQRCRNFRVTKYCVESDINDSAQRDGVYSPAPDRQTSAQAHGLSLQQSSPTFTSMYIDIHTEKAPKSTFSLLTTYNQESTPGLLSTLDSIGRGSSPGAALPHFGRYGKGGDTGFFCPFDKFFGHFFLFFAPMSPDFAHCVTCF